MAAYNKLKDFDSEDFESMLMEVEKSFGIKFVSPELDHITTFGELCDLITNKITLAHADGCTTQQAFYKLREAISGAIGIDNISPNTQLSVILPRKDRIKKVKTIENRLGFKLDILEPKTVIIFALLFILLASFITLFIHWQTGLCGIIASFLGFWLANKTAQDLAVQTVGQVAEKMQRENYINSRRNPGTANKKEIEKVLTDWFSEEFELDKSQLRDEKFS